MANANSSKDKRDKPRRDDPALTESDSSDFSESDSSDEDQTPIPHKKKAVHIKLPNQHSGDADASLELESLSPQSANNHGMPSNSLSKSSTLSSESSNSIFVFKHFALLLVEVFLFPLAIPTFYNSIPTPDIQAGFWPNSFFIFAHIPACLWLSVITHTPMWGAGFNLQFQGKRIFWWVLFPWNVAFIVLYCLENLLLFFPLPANSILAMWPSFIVPLYGWWKLTKVHAEEQYPNTYTQRDLILNAVRCGTISSCILFYFGVNLFLWSLFQNSDNKIQYAVQVAFFLLQFLIKRICEMLTGKYIELSEALLLMPLAFGVFYKSLTTVDISAPNVFLFSCILDFITPFLGIITDVIDLKKQPESQSVVEDTGMKRFLSMPLPVAKPKIAVVSSLHLVHCSALRNITISLSAQFVYVVAPIYFLVLYSLTYYGPNRGNYLINSISEENLFVGLYYSAISFGVRSLASALVMLFLHFYVTQPAIPYFLEVVKREKYHWGLTIGYVALIAIKFTLRHSNTDMLHFYIGKWRWE